MAAPAQSMPPLPQPPDERAAAEALATRPTVGVLGRELPRPQPRPAALRLVEVPASSNSPALLGRKKDSAVLRGLKDMQQLQKQTVAVLESIRGDLAEIQQVLRSPEATRGLEKQQNAALLLSRGFAREAADQAQGAALLLPASPEAQLLLSLSLAADQQFDASLAAARKGLALFDRRTHPAAIEAGLLHALAALGCAAEAVERWAAIIDSLSLTLLCEHIGRIAACFPAQAPEGRLDDLLNRRIARYAEQRSEPRRLRQPAPSPDDETPAATLFTALDAAQQSKLLHTHRALLGLIAGRLLGLKDPADLLRFLTECVVPLANRGLDKSARALGRAAAKRLLVSHADAMVLHRALQKFQMAGDERAVEQLATLLRHWRQAGTRALHAGRHLRLAGLLTVAGAALFAYMLWPLGALAGKTVLVSLFGVSMPALWIGPVLMMLGALLCLYALIARTAEITLPYDRPPLTREELAYLNTPEVRQSLRAATAARR